MIQPPADYLPSVVAELKTCKLVIDFEPGEGVQVPGDFLVSVGRNRKVGSVYQILERHNVKSTKNPRRYKFIVTRCPELKAATTVDFRFNCKISGHESATVITIIWNNRTKKK